VRFVVTGEWTRNSLLRAIVWCFLFYVVVLWVTNALMYFSRMGLTPASVVQYYRGDASRYLQPRTFAGLLEVLHFHSFAVGILLLTLTHLLLFVPLSVRVRTWGVALAFASAVLEESSGWAVRFVHPSFAWLKIASFLCLQAVLLWIVAMVVRVLWRGEPSAYNQSNGAARTG